MPHSGPCLQVQCDSAQERFAKARQNLDAAVTAFKAKHTEVELLETAREDQNNVQRNVQAEFRDLAVRSEQELDAKVLIRRDCCMANTRQQNGKPNAAASCSIKNVCLFAMQCPTLLHVKNFCSAAKIICNLVTPVVERAQHVTVCVIKRMHGTGADQTHGAPNGR